jgi:hypothetical protein
MLFTTVILTSIILFLSLSVVLLCNLTPESSSFLGVGRGRFVVDLSITRSDVAIELARYDKPLLHYHPDATLIRTRGYGWFVDNLRGTVFEGHGFRFVTAQSDYEFSTRLFETTWSARAPMWFSLAATAITPALALLRRRIRRPSAIQRISC